MRHRHHQLDWTEYTVCICVCAFDTHVIMVGVYYCQWLRVSSMILFSLLCVKSEHFTVISFSVVIFFPCDCRFILSVFLNSIFFYSKFFFFFFAAALALVFFLYGCLFFIIVSAINACNSIRLALRSLFSIDLIARWNNEIREREREKERKWMEES